MNEIEYVFGTGDGSTHTWTSQADLDLAGTAAGDAVRLDFDGDGLADDAMWDTDGDGVADVAALDLADDGRLDSFYTDPSGLGTWDHRVTGAHDDARQEPLDWIVRTEPAGSGPGTESPQAEPDRLMEMEIIVPHPNSVLPQAQDTDPAWHTPGPALLPDWHGTDPAGG